MKQKRKKVGDVVQLTVDAEVVMAGRYGYVFTIHRPYGIAFYKPVTRTGIKSLAKKATQVMNAANSVSR